MARRINVFYGYPFAPPAIGETIEAATKGLRRHPEIVRNRLRFKPWRDVRASGKHLATTITENIDRSQIFACDLTYLNNNVSFELGYAIGQFKRVFVSVDTSIKDSERRFKRNYSNLVGLGYSPYHNHEQLKEQLLVERPWEELERSVLNTRYRRRPGRRELPTLLYVKPEKSTSSVLGAVEVVRASLFGNSLIIDDPLDNPSPSLDWYAEQLTTADAIIVHLLSTEHEQSETHNIKGSLIAGLAHGLQRPLLMLAHSPHESPVDYAHLMRIHATAESCNRMTENWLSEIGAKLPRRRERRSQEVPREKLELRHMALGQHVAEHERDDLDDYFVETSPYYRALEGPTTVLIGRRGTGKTAILYAIHAELEPSNRDHVTVLNPVGYEMEGLVRVLEEIREFSERGFLIESLWKYLIYSEVALSCEESLNARPVHQSPSPEEREFLTYCESNAELIRLPFSVRLQIAVDSLHGTGRITNAVEQRARISERLHETFIGKLRTHLGSVLADFRQLAILIDNLDGPWTPGANVESLSELIRGLLNVVQDIPRDLRRSTYRLRPVDTRVAVLLRSDIFAFVRPLIPEQDKLPIERVVWDDEGLLLRILNQRLLRNAPNHITESDIWQQLFPPEVAGVGPIDFIMRTTLPRPRDAIFLLREAINNAINRQHDSVQPEDLLDARNQYSEFAFRSVLAEDDPNRRKLEAVLYEFAGAERTVTVQDVMHRMSIAGVEEEHTDWYIDLLCDIGFLGISTVNGFRYSREEGERSMLRAISLRLAAQNGTKETFEINPAFYQVLQIE